MYIFPLAATLVSLVFSAQVFRQYLQKQKPYQLVWSLALLMFGLGALAETLATVGAWSELLVKMYYLFGGTLVVGYLGAGTLYVSGDFDAGGRVATFLLGRRFNTLLSVTLTFLLWLMIYGFKMFKTNAAIAGLISLLYLVVLVAAIAAKEKVPTAYLVILLIASALAAYAISQGTIDTAKLSELKGWHALNRTRAIKTGAFSLNVVGSFLLIVGAIQSAVGLTRKHIMRERAVGNILIAAGVLVVAGGGTIGGLLGLGGQAAISAPMAIGVTVMFLGFLETGRQSSPATADSPSQKQPRTTA